MNSPVAPADCVVTLAAYAVPADGVNVSFSSLPLPVLVVEVLLPIVAMPDPMIVS